MVTKRLVILGGRPIDMPRGRLARHNRGCDEAIVFLAVGMPLERRHAHVPCLGLHFIAKTWRICSRVSSTRQLLFMQRREMLARCASAIGMPPSEAISIGFVIFELADLF